MSVEVWLAGFGEPLGTDALELPSAVTVVRFIERYAAHLATLVEVRRTVDLELVVLDFRTGRPQESVYPIKQVERIGVFFTTGETMPLIFMLRDDFPDTEHQQLVPEGIPKSICIDDRVWGEARLTWTPAELIQRILSWFSRAARGELHDAHQPIDPILFGSMLNFIVSRAAIEGDDRNLIAVHDDEDKTTLKVMPLDQVEAPIENLEPICLITYRIPPEQMTRMRYAPATLGGLAAMLADRGIDLFADLATRFSEWLNNVAESSWRLQARFVVIVDMPIIAPRGEQQDGSDIRAFVTSEPTGEIAVALGLAYRAEQKIDGSNAQYLKAVRQMPVNEEALHLLQAQAAEVHLLFDRPLATRLSGHTSEDARKAILVGAGAIGSHIADCLGREGRFVWTVIDHDSLLPHNLARHTARKSDVMRNKAELVSEALSALLDSTEPTSRPIPANVFTNKDEREQIDQALVEADIIIDATASVLAERFVSDHPSNARRVSTFFNPAGDSAVLLTEPADRSVSLRDIEAQYLGQITRVPGLADHLAKPTVAIAYTGACRAITNSMPQSNVMTLSGLVATGLGRAADEDHGLVKIWSLSPDGSVAARKFDLQQIQRFKVGAWAVTIDAGLIARIGTMRREKLPNETGGVLFGVIDIPARSIHLVEATPAPPDSEESKSGFVRGTEGVAEEINRIYEQTNGQVRYIGEWHSHPPKAGAQPSAIDLAQIDWLAALFDMDTLPALMLIAADEQVSVILANKEADGGCR